MIYILGILSKNTVSWNNVLYDIDKGYAYAQVYVSNDQIFLVLKKLFFTDNHQLIKKGSISPEILPDLKKSIFVIRITFFTKLGNPLLKQRM